MNVRPQNNANNVFYYAQTNVPVVSDKSKKTAAICCLLGFVGLGGIQYFYVGRIGKGILYFFTFGLFFFGTIFDLIKILSGTFLDAFGAVVK